jgi:protein-tyrosine phosphatase
MKTINLSREAALDIERAPEDTVFISINDEYEEDVSLQFHNVPILYLKFADLRGGYAVQHKEKWYHPIQPEDTMKILSFIEEYKDKNIIVNCSAGISRSGAISIFIHLFYGHALKKDFWVFSRPNEYILGALINNHLNKGIR